MADLKLDYKLLPSQMDYLKHRDEPSWAFPAAIGSGKTFVVALDVCMRVVQDAYRILIGSQTFTTTKTVQFKQILEFLDSWNVEYDYDKSNLILTLPNGGEIRGTSSAAENSVTGATLYNMAVFDESYLWDNDARLYIEGRCRGIDKSGNLIKPKYRYIGSPPLEPLGWYYDYLKGHPDKVTHSSMWDAEGKTLSREYIESQIEAYGGESSPLCRIQCYGELPDENSSTSIFRREHRPVLIPVSMGVDCSGGEGNDEAYFTITNGIDIIHESSMKDFTQKELLSHSLALIDQYNVIDTKIDTTGGFGTYLAEAITDNHKTVTKVNFGESAKNNKEYANARAEMYVNCANRWNDSWGDRYQKERLCTGYLMNSSGKLQLIKKEQIKAILGYSPDGLDSLCLALYTDSKNKVLPLPDRDTTYNILQGFKIWA